MRNPEKICTNPLRTNSDQNQPFPCKAILEKTTLWWRIMLQSRNTQNNYPSHLKSPVMVLNNQPSSMSPESWASLGPWIQALCPLRFSTEISWVSRCFHLDQDVCRQFGKTYRISTEHVISFLGWTRNSTLCVATKRFLTLWLLVPYSLDCELRET